MVNDNIFASVNKSLWTAEVIKGSMFETREIDGHLQSLPGLEVEKKKYRYAPFPFPSPTPFPSPPLLLEVGTLKSANAFLAYFAPRKCIWMQRF